MKELAPKWDSPFLTKVVLQADPHCIGPLTRGPIIGPGEAWNVKGDEAKMAKLGGSCSGLSYSSLRGSQWRQSLHCFQDTAAGTTESPSRARRRPWHSKRLLMQA